AGLRHRRPARSAREIRRRRTRSATSARPAARPGPSARPRAVRHPQPSWAPGPPLPPAPPVPPEGDVEPPPAPAPPAPPEPEATPPSGPVAAAGQPNVVLLSSTPMGRGPKVGTGQPSSKAPRSGAWPVKPSSMLGKNVPLSTAREPAESEQSGGGRRG